MSRPAADVVVPFAGGEAAFARLARTLARLSLAPGDTLTVVDNRPAAARPLRAAAASPPLRVLRADARQSSYFARNRGAAAGTAPWLVFLDADTTPAPDLLDAYLGNVPGERTGVLAGAVIDAAPAAGAPLAARYAAARADMGQDSTLSQGAWAYAQTANCAVRRAALEAVGGFDERARSGGDADLCFRLRGAGWGLESRPAARVTHAGRARVLDLMRQKARHGAGAAWLEHRHPGSSPPRRKAGLAWWAARRAAGAAAAWRRGERERARHALLEPVLVWCFELGRALPNEAAAGRRRWSPLGRLLR